MKHFYEMPNDENANAGIYTVENCKTLFRQNNNHFSSIKTTISLFKSAIRYIWKSVVKWKD